MIASTGWTWEYVDGHMTFPRFYALLDHWQKHPPVHLLVAAFLGYGEKTRRPGTLNELVADFKQAGGRVGRA